MRIHDERQTQTITAAIQTRNNYRAGNRSCAQCPEVRTARLRNCGPSQATAAGISRSHSLSGKNYPTSKGDCGQNSKAWSSASGDTGNKGTFPGRQEKNPRGTFQ